MPIQASCVEEYVCRTSLVMTITQMCQSVCCVSKILARRSQRAGLLMLLRTYPRRTFSSVQIENWLAAKKSTQAKTAENVHFP